MQQMFFIADLIACSTCFVHHFAHHQELERIIQLVAACGLWCLVFNLSVWCGAEGCVSDLRTSVVLASLQLKYRGADKSLARPERKQTTATEDFEFHISYFNNNWRNVSTIYIYNKTNIKRNILRGADKSLARPGRKEATATENFEFFISYL
jgi:hypothetical protein